MSSLFGDLADALDALAKRIPGPAQHSSSWQEDLAEVLLGCLAPGGGLSSEIATAVAIARRGKLQRALEGLRRISGAYSPTLAPEAEGHFRTAVEILREGGAKPNPTGGVFLSHVSEEAVIAGVLKSHLARHLGDGIPIFVSSDFVSIPGGAPWFEKIVTSVRNARVVVAILTPESVDRRWINFETGIAVGESGLAPFAKVIPVCLNGLEKGSVGLPLSGLQVRKLDSDDEATAFLMEVAGRCDRAGVSADASSLLSDLRIAERALPRRQLEMEAVASGGNLRFRLRNGGNKNLNLIRVELAVPKAATDPNWGIVDARPAWTVERCTRHGVDYLKIVVIAGEQPARYNPNFVPLTKVLTPDMSPYDVENLRCLAGNVGALSENAPVEYVVDTESGRFAGSIHVFNGAA